MRKVIVLVLALILVMGMAAPAYAAETTAADTSTVPEDTTAPVPETSASFVACGDNIIYFGTYRDAAAQAFDGGRQYNFAPIYKNVKDVISAADIAFINQETPCSESFAPESYPI